MIYIVTWILLEKLKNHEIMQQYCCCIRFYFQQIHLNKCCHIFQNLINVHENMNFANFKLSSSHKEIISGNLIIN